MEKRNIRLIKMLRLQEVIYASANSTIYKALIGTDEMESDELYYAVKVLTDSVSPLLSIAEEMRKSQKIENRTTTSVTIPLLMHISEDGKEYGIMQFKTNGKFLEQLICELEKKHGGSVPPELSVLLIEKVLRSVSDIHTCNGADGGFLHLDINPRNIYMENADLDHLELASAKFIDFQFAEEVSSDGKYQGKREIAGISHGYSAPELISPGETGISYAADLYSIGAILYRMLTGEVYSPLTGLHMENLSLPYILKYRIISFLECILEHDQNYRYDNAVSVLQVISEVRECFQMFRDKKYYSLLKVAYHRQIPLPITSDMVLDPIPLKNAIWELDLATRQDHIDYEECEYIFCALYSKISDTWREYLMPSDYALLLSSGLASATSLAKDREAVQRNEQILSLKEEIPINLFLRISNRMAVIYADHQSHEKALKLIEKNVFHLEAVKNIHRQIADDLGTVSESACYNVDLARAYSSLGCRLVYSGKEGALSFFEKAIREFSLCNDARERDGNISITVCHILHYAILTNDILLFERYVGYICKGSGWAEWYQACKHDSFHPYNIWVILKGLHNFQSDKIPEALYLQLERDMESGVFDQIHQEAIKRLVYRYAGLICLDASKDLSDSGFLEAFRRSISIRGRGSILTDKDLNIIMCINYHTKWIFQNLLHMDDENEILKQELQRRAETYGWTELAEWIRKNDNLDNMLILEYC